MVAQPPFGNRQMPGPMPAPAVGVPAAKATATGAHGGGSANQKKQVLPTPPLVLRDYQTGAAYERGPLLGQGGFARCFQVRDEHGRIFAAKLVSKASLKAPKHHQKLQAEIRIHGHMDHRNIVKFHHHFEDEEFVYLILDLCEHKSLMDMLRKRKRLSEPEVRYFMIQILNAVQYMHRCHVIHRDLKLGNLFLAGDDLNVKVGDFGLATYVKHEGERKKTICGTPNYIAPEILFDTKNGHSYEVDIWSVGVIMYTMLIGRPPFQTKEIKAIYAKIKDNSYEFPDTAPISPAAKRLIQSLLKTNPGARPQIEKIMQDPFFEATFPKIQRLTVSALTVLPDFENSPGLLSSNHPSLLYMNHKQVRKEQHQAVTTAGATAGVLPGATRGGATLDRLGSGGMGASAGGMVTAGNPGMAPSSAAASAAAASRRQKTASGQFGRTLPRRSPAELPSHNAAVAAAHHQQRPNAPDANMHPPQVVAPNSGGEDVELEKTGAGMLETVYKTLEHFFDELKKGTLSLSPSPAGFDNHHHLHHHHQHHHPLPNQPTPPHQQQQPKVFISKWIDYSNRYGLGYELTNGCFGVYFNDSTSLVLAPDGIHFEYLYFTKHRQSMKRQYYSLNEIYPADLNKKVTLLKHFKGYMQENLYKAQYSYTDHNVQRNLDFLTKYVRTKSAVLFRLSNQILQINFFDHTKIVLSDMGHTITYINQRRTMETFELTRFLLEGPKEGVSRLKYSRDVLMHLYTRRRDHRNGAGGNNPHHVNAKDENLIPRNIPGVMGAAVAR